MGVYTYLLHEKLMRDLEAQHKDYAVFPAISGSLTELLGRCNSVEGYIPDGRVPNGFEHGS